MKFVLPFSRHAEVIRLGFLPRHALLLGALVASPVALSAADDQGPGGRRGGDAVQRGPRDGDAGNRDFAQRGPDGRGPSSGDRGPRQGGPPFGGSDRPEGRGPAGRGPGGPEGFGPGGPRGGAFGPMAGRPGAGPEMMMRMMPVLAALDADQDGVISASEISNASKALMKLDRNGDGKLTAEELRPGLGQRGNGQGGRPGGPPSRGPEARGPEARGPEARGPGGRPEGIARGEAMGRMFESRDQDGDGMLRGDEIPEQMASRLDRIDQNGDGAISREELKGMMDRFREAGQAGPRPGGRPGGAGRPEGRGPRPGGEVPRRPGSDQ